MYRRINITLPEETVQLIDRMVPKGDRSHFINEALKYYIAQTQKNKLKQQLKEGAIRQAERDLNLAQDWIALEEEAWLQKEK